MHPVQDDPTPPKSDRDKPKYFVPALEKGLDILEYLSEVSVPRSQAEIARALGRNTGEIFRMLECLENRDYLFRDGSARYRLSLKMFTLSHTHSPVEQLLQVARGPMRELALEILESVHIGVLRDHTILILAEEVNPEPIRISVEVGRSFPAIRTASGRLLLAHLAEEELADFLATDREVGKLDRRERSALLEGFERARGDRYVVAASGFSLGVRDVSVLLGDPRSGVAATLAAPLLLAREEEQDVGGILSAMQACAAEITRKLGVAP